MRHELEVLALRWLWLERGCHYLLEERSPRGGLGEPDVLGVTRGRHLLEVEVKRSLSDFRADAKKWHRLRIVSVGSSERYAKVRPLKIWYAVPRELETAVRKELPAWAGLLVPSERGSKLLEAVEAPANRESERLGLDECVRLARCLVNHNMSLRERVRELEDRLKNSC